MATGRESLYNWNNGAYSATGYPFQANQLKLQASYSTSVYDTVSLQSTVYVSVTLANIGIDWGYFEGREVSVYWNDALVAKINPPNLQTSINVNHVTSLGNVSFPVQHQSDGTCSGTLKVEWATVVLAYTVGGVTKNITELGCKASVVADPIEVETGTIPTDLLMINGINFLSVCQKDGIEISRAEVNKKSVITMNGTEWAKERIRHTISVKLLDMSSDQFAEYAAALATNPGAVSYRDAEDGMLHSSAFYILNIKYTKRMVIPGVVYLTGISFELSERSAF